MLSEFDLIARYFTRSTPPDGAVVLGIGDDCALLAPAAGMQLAISTDMLVEGRHFFPGADPTALGHKTLAVNLSDLAAMGATPVAFTLALSLPAADPAWLAPFSGGLLALADAHGCTLIGGDTTKGPLTFSITVFGNVPPGKALRRDAAQPEDDIWVSGQLGDARLALAHYRNELVLDEASLTVAAERMHRPQPRIALGPALCGVAHAALDVSDGLIGDLGHILKRSAVGATVDIDAIPVGHALRSQPRETQRRFALTGGDDYELCFTAPPERRSTVVAAADAAGIAVTRIGSIDAAPGLRLTDSAGALLDFSAASFDHFSPS
jgi:thiamine-monophosphate kinase